MSNNISSDNSSVSKVSMPITSPALTVKKDSSNASVMFYVMKSMQDTIKGDMQCLQKQTKEEMEKQAIAKVLLTIKGLPNQKDFLEKVLRSLGLSDSELKTYVNGLLEGVEQAQAEEQKIKDQEQQAQAKMDADNDLTKHPAYEDKYVFTPDLKEEGQDFKSGTAGGIFKGLWNIVDGKSERNLMRLGLCKMNEAILKNPNAKKAIGFIVNSKTFKGLVGDSDSKNSNGGIAQFLASSTNHPILADILSYSDKINKWIDKEEVHFGKRLSDLNDKLGTKGQAWYSYVGEFTTAVCATLADTLFTTDAKAFRIVSGDSTYTIDPDKTTLSSWTKDVQGFEMNAQNISDLIVKDSQNKIDSNIQLGKKGLDDLNQATKSSNNYGEMLSSLVVNNKV